MEDKECDHSYIFRDDIGHVCRVCGVVDKSIESIIEFQRPKVWLYFFFSVYQNCLYDVYKFPLSMSIIIDNVNVL